MYDSDENEEVIEDFSEKTESVVSEDSAGSVYIENDETEEIKVEISESEEGELIESITEYTVGDTPDYTSYFENLQVLSFLQLAVIIGLGVAICFCKGFDKK